MHYQLTLTSEELATLPAGLRAKARRKHERKPKQGAYRSALVTFADGEQVRAGSYAIDDAAALQRIESFARAASRNPVDDRPGVHPRHTHIRVSIDHANVRCILHGFCSNVTYEQ